MLNRVFFDMKWTSHLRQIRILFIIIAMMIALASLVVSHLLVSDLAKEETARMEVWAEAMRSLNAADEYTDLSLVLKVINENHTIPVIVMTHQGKIQTYRNVDLKGKTRKDSLNDAISQAKRMRAEGHVIRILLDKHREYIDVCYDESLLLRRLSWYPYVQLSVVLLFVCPVDAKTRRTKPCLGRVEQGNGTSTRFTHLKFNGLDGNHERELS